MKRKFGGAGTSFVPILYNFRELLVAMDGNLYGNIISLIRREVVPAIGCTEPIAVALCVAKAARVLGCTPQDLVVSLSPNIYKNAMGVGIPNTGMTGLPIAVALGATMGNPDLGLEVLRDTTPESVEVARRFLASRSVNIGIERNACDLLYIRCAASVPGHTAVAVISGSHTSFTHVELDGVAVGKSNTRVTFVEGKDLDLNMRLVYDFATTVPIEDIGFLWESGEMNVAAAELSFNGDYGHGLGAMLRGGETGTAVFGDTLFRRILAYTSGACDARMSGAMVPVMSNSGSGNQGISATVPVVVYAREHGVGREATLRALAMSHLTVIYMKQSLGRLSALCGCVVAATGSSCGITMLMGGGYEEITYAVKNMVANLTGMICDGAKPSCSLKVTSGVATAVLSAVMAVNHRFTTSIEGIIDDDVDQCIRNLTSIGRDGMHETDKMILEIMNSKCAR